MKTTACMLLLAAAAWCQQVAVPQGGSLGPSCNLSDATTLGADKLDGSHGSATPAANAVPVAAGNGRLAAGWIPLPTTSSIGGIFMDADCLAGNHVNGIDLATGLLKCTADASSGGGLGGTVTAGKIMLAATSSTAGDSSMTENSGDITSTKKQKAPSFEGTATTDQGLDLPAVTSETVSAAGHAKLIAKNNQLQLSVNGGAFGSLGASLPPGSNMQLPYNSNGAWGALTGYAINPSTGEMTVPGPVSTTGTSQIGNITESTPSNAVAGKGKVMFRSTTHRPTYCYDGTTLPCSDVVLQADASATSSAGKIVKQDASGKVDGSLLPLPTTTTPGAVYMPANCSSGHVNGINTATGQLTCTDDSGGGGGGAWTKRYDTPVTGQRGSISATTMYTPASDGMFQFSAAFSQQDTGTGCTATASVVVQVLFTDAYNSGTYTMLMNKGNGDGAGAISSNATLSYTTIARTNMPVYYPFTFRAKGGTNIQLATQYNNAANCTSQPAYNLIPILLQLN